MAQQPEDLNLKYKREVEHFAAGERVYFPNDLPIIFWAYPFLQRLSARIRQLEARIADLEQQRGR